jgi:hypothetical protein
MFFRTLVIAALACCCAAPGRSYSVLSHEAIIDVLWEVRIMPILRARFPQATPEAFHEAHAYAYGGAIIQDLGYYPMGSKFFSDLTHYVRSGDFVTNLVVDSNTLDELAFSLGALSHYVADGYGHSLGTNRAEPLLYPKLRARFGDVITYEDDPIAHLQTEFGFDVLESAKGRFAPQAYQEFIGFQVATTLLERAFRETYCLELTDVIRNVALSVGSYRHALSKTIPLATKVAWAQRQEEIRRSEPGITRSRFLFNMSRSSYHKEWGYAYQAPGLWSRILAFILKLVPKIGPLRALKFHMPTPEVERVFMQSFNVAVAHYRDRLSSVSNSSLTLPDINFDTGDQVRPAVYRLVDKTYADLIERLAKKKFAGVDEQLKGRVLGYYANLQLPFATKNDEKKWRRLEADLDELRSAAAVPVRAAR